MLNLFEFFFFFSLRVLSLYASFIPRYKFSNKQQQNSRNHDKKDQLTCYFVGYLLKIC